MLMLFDLCEFDLNEKWHLIYRASDHGARASDFHSRCDNKPKTLTIIKAARTGNVFGGYTNAVWDQTSQFKADPNAFVFSLVNGEKRPIRIRIGDGQESYAIYCDPSRGPVFGNGYDICISDNFNENDLSATYFGCTYVLPNYKSGSNEALNLLAGSFQFQVADIEVFQIN